MRVTAIRDSIFASPDSLRATVTLEKVGSGRPVAMKYLRKHYPSVNPDAVADYYAHLFWTTEPLEPGATYRLTAVAEDGATASATVKMPDPVTSITISIRNDTTALVDVVRIPGEIHLALLDVLHGEARGRTFQSPVRRNRAGTGVSDFQTLRTVRPVDGGFNPPFWIRVCAHYRECWIRITLSGAPWPYSQLLAGDQSVYDLVVSNVENGSGFLGGITTMEVPYEACFIPFSTVPYCDLRYDGNTAVLEGSFVDPGCPGPRISQARVLLRRVDLARVRPDTLRSDRTFRIAAIEPDVAHELIVTTFDFDTPAVPLVFTPGEHRRIELPLVRARGRCA